jgi:hypothetical protein
LPNDHKQDEWDVSRKETCRPNKVAQREICRSVASKWDSKTNHLQGAFCCWKSSTSAGHNKRKSQDLLLHSFRVHVRYTKNRSFLLADLVHLLANASAEYWWPRLLSELINITKIARSVK